MYWNGSASFKSCFKIIRGAFDASHQNSSCSQLVLTLFLIFFFLNWICLYFKRKTDSIHISINYIECSKGVNETKLTEYGPLLSFVTLQTLLSIFSLYFQHLLIYLIFGVFMWTRFSVLLSTVIILCFPFQLQWLYHSYLPR